MSVEGNKNTESVHHQEEQQIEGINAKGFFSEDNNKGGCSVRVAVRVRPLIGREQALKDDICVRSDSTKNQIEVGGNKQFGFDKVFGIDAKQSEIFDMCVKNLVLGSFSGYNSTVLAYGQTGSGKTYTMGTDATISIGKDQEGILPRVIHLMFEEVDKRSAKREFIIKVSFIEIYNEEIRDLLDPQGQTKIIIRELARGIPSLCGQREEVVTDYKSLFKLLESGALHRRTKSTLMNESSSRSHAIFTINIEQHLIEDLVAKDTHPTIPNTEIQEFTTAKFHFVDLAGSERIKKTGAEGDTMQEGISINKALFVLGKVINALTDESGKTSYRPYRESNLTRILQDSLGGNSRTTMIACVSPAESNLEETLSTLLYACKARSIKNKPVVNSDLNTTLIHQLQQQVGDLQRELSRYKKGFVQRPNAIQIPLDLNNETNVEKQLKVENAVLKKSVEQLKNELNTMGEESRKREIDFLTIIQERDVLRLKNEKLISMTTKNGAGSEILIKEELSLIEEYRTKFNDLQSQNKKKEQDYKDLLTKYEEEFKAANVQNEQNLKLNEEIQQLKRSLVKLRKQSNPSQIKRSQLFCSKEKERESIATQESLSEEQSMENKQISGTWLSTDLEEQLKVANEMFINQFTVSLEALMPENHKSSETSNKENQAFSKERVELFLDEKTELDSEEEEPEKKEQENEIGKEIKETLNKVEGDIHEREAMLLQIKEKHKEMQNSLIEIMKQQYHKTVEKLEIELEKVKADQEKAIQIAPKDSRNNVERQYIKKIAEYEAKIKEGKKNDAQQQKMQKQATDQEAKIQSLADEINRMKQQKLELTKQIKKERENNEKIKREQRKETQKLKQENIMQKNLITKLTKEKERTNKSKQAARNETEKITKNQKRESLINTRKFIDDFVKRVVTIRQEICALEKEEFTQADIESRISNDYVQLGKLKLVSNSLSLKKEGIDQIKDYDVLQSIEAEIEQNNKIMLDIQTAIDTMETNLQYHEEKTARLEKNRNLMKIELAQYKNK